mmetsp:Transcript_101062/g.193653  ORF Transcript_101062/g.193653 Transcript_101062/m.193653 type:complete len:1861 (+) Transcript_101062:497-6079(+)
MKQAEIRKLYQRINKMEMGFDALDRVEQRDLEEQLGDLQCENEALREEREECHREIEEKDETIKENEKLIAELKEEVELTRALVEKRENKHKQLLGLVEEEKNQIEKKLEKERKEWQETRKSLMLENTRLSEEAELLKAVSATSKEPRLDTAYQKVKLIRSKKRYSGGDANDENHGETEEDGSPKSRLEERRSTLTSMPRHITSLSSPRPSGQQGGDPNSHIFDLLKGSRMSTIDQIEEGAEAEDGSSATADEDAEKKRTFLEKVEEKRRRTVEAREKMKAADGDPEFEGDLPERDQTMEAQVSGESQGDEMDEIEKLWAQVYSKPVNPDAKRKEEEEAAQLDPDALISLVIESIENLAKKGPVARKKAAMALVCDMGLNEMRALRDSLDARAYAALNGLKEPIVAAQARQKAGKTGPPLKSRPGSPLTSRGNSVRQESKSRAGSPKPGDPAASPYGSRRGSVREGNKSGKLDPNRQNLNAPESPKRGGNLRPLSPSGGRSGAATISRPASRASPSGRNRSRRRRQKDGEAEERGNGNEDEIGGSRSESDRRKAFADDPSELDMNAVSERLRGHIEDGVLKGEELGEGEERPGEEDKRSFSSSGSADEHFEHESRQGSEHGSEHGDSRRSSKRKETERKAETRQSEYEDIPVDELLSSWNKPWTAETESTRPGHSAGTAFGELEELPDVDQDSPLAKRVRRQKELNTLFRILKDPRLGKPRKLNRATSPDMHDLKKRQTVQRKTMLMQSAVAGEDEEDEDDEELNSGRRTEDSGMTPLLEGKQESEAKPRAKSLPAPHLEGMRLMDQLDLLPDVVTESHVDGEEKRGRGSRKSRASIYRSGSGASTPDSPRARSDSSRSLGPSRRGSRARKSFSTINGKQSGGKSRRGSFNDSFGNYQRSHSLPPCWSMPMHLEPDQYPELSEISDQATCCGLRRLLVELPDLPPRHYKVASELLLAGWVLSHPEGHAYQSMYDANDFDHSRHSMLSTGQGDGYLDSSLVAEHASAAGFSYMPEMAMPSELMVRSLRTPGAQQRSSQKFLSPSDSSPRHQGTESSASAGAADGDAAAGSTRPGPEESPRGSDGNRRGSGARSRSSTSASSARGAEYSAAAAAGQALSHLRRGMSLANHLSKGRAMQTGAANQDFRDLTIAGHGVASTGVGGVGVRQSGYKMGGDTLLESLDDAHDAGSRPGTSAQAQEQSDKSGDEMGMPKGPLTGRKLMNRSTTLTIDGPGSPAPNSSHAFPPSKFSVHHTMPHAPLPTGQQHQHANFLPRRDAAGAFQKAMRGHGFRVVAGLGALARGRQGRQADGGGMGDLAFHDHGHAVHHAVAAFKKPRMVSVGTQTNLSVTTRFEVVPDADETDLAMKWRETARHADKEELRVRIAKELLNLCLEIRTMAGMNDAQEKPSSMFQTPASTGHIGEDLLGRSPVQFNNLGLSIAGLHRPLLPKGSMKTSIRSRRQLQSQFRNSHAMALLERGGAIGKGLGGGGGLGRRATVTRPSLRQLAEGRFSMDEDGDPFSLKGRPALDSQRGLKQFTFQMTEGNSSGEEELAHFCVCGWHFAPDETFCHKCGAQRPGVAKQNAICSCGNPFAPSAVFCRRCGAMRPMDALGGAGVAHHRHDEDELDPGKTRLTPRSQGTVTFQGKEEELGAFNKNSAATMSTVASESSLPAGWHALSQRQLASSGSDEQVTGQGLPEINPVEQLFEKADDLAKRSLAEPRSGLAVSARSMATKPRQATRSRKRPGTGPGGQKPENLQRGKIDVNRIVNAIREADDTGIPGDLRNMADDVVEKSRQWLSHDNRQHGGGPPLTARPLGRPQTQEQQRTRRTSELPPVDNDDSRWYPNQSRDSVTALPLRALLKR